MHLMPLEQIKRTLPRIALASAFACMLVLLPACGGGGGGQAAAALPGGGTASATGADFNPPESILIPQIEGDAGGGTLIDTSGTSQGYVCAQAYSASRLKFQVKSGDQTYNYDLPNDGTPRAFPVNMGDGDYAFRIMQNTEGSNYVELDSTYEYVSLESEFAPFLIPNMFCDYTESSECVKQAAELTKNATNQAEAVGIICEYIAGSISYDKPKAEQLAQSTGYVPNPDETLSSRKGICFDYSSLAAAMLRSLGFPTKIVTGYVAPDDFYHAWIMVYVDGEWKTAQFEIDRNTWSRMDVTFASSGASQYVGDGSAYTDKYVY